jgi:hypothetical protein
MAVTGSGRAARLLAGGAATVALTGAILVGSAATADASPMDCMMMEFRYNEAVATRNHYWEEGRRLERAGNTIGANYQFGYMRHWDLVIAHLDLC